MGTAALLGAVAELINATNAFTPADLPRLPAIGGCSHSRPTSENAPGDRRVGARALRRCAARRVPIALGLISLLLVASWVLLDASIAAG